MKTERYMSLNLGCGKTHPMMRKISIKNCLKFICENAYEKKEDCYLLAYGYSSSSVTYHRGEESFDKIDTILLDFDNKDANPNLLKEFEEAYSQYQHIIWETASSTKECPKFRALFVLDETMDWKVDGDGNKITKKAILRLFSNFTPDEGASWYFGPCKSKLQSFSLKKGSMFPSKLVRDKENEIQSALVSKKLLSTIHMEMSRLNGDERTFVKKDFHELPLVKEYLTSQRGNRNTSAHKAACSMFARCYEEYEVRRMLMEGPLEKSEITTVLHSAKRCKK